MKNIIRSIQLLFLVTLISGAAIIVRADVKIKSRQTAAGQTIENTTYIKGKRQRTETGAGAGGEMISVTQCDLSRDLQIMPAGKVYTINVWENDSAIVKAAPAAETRTSKGGLVTSTITTKDTGERKQMFGYTAKHLIITMETKSSPDSCSPMNSKMQFDGWYIDAAFALDCLTERYKKNVPRTTNSGCQDRYETKQVGTAKRGYAVWEKTTMYDESGKETFSTLNEVIEISNAALDSALFDIPAGYAEVKDSAALYSSAAQNANIEQLQRASDSAIQSANTDGASGNIGLNPGLGANAGNMAKNSNNAASEIGAKKAGVIRIGLANVKTGAVGDGLNATDLSAAIKNTLKDYLKSPNLEIVELEAKLSSAIDAESKQKECDFVIYVQVSHKKGGGGFGFGKMLGQVVSQTPFGNTGSVAGNIAGQVATTAVVSAASLSSNVKAKDEITLEINLKNAVGAAALTKQFKAKAKGNGDDIITTVVEQAAEAIAGALKS